MRRILSLLICALVLTALVPMFAQGQQGFSIIVNANNQVNGISKSDANKMFLRKTKKWDNGETVEPVDLPADATVRARFSDTVLGRDVNAIKSYWQRQIFSGRSTPPPERDSEAEVIDFVRNNAGAIGYVSAGASLPSGVKRITLLD